MSHWGTPGGRQGLACMARRHALRRLGALAGVMAAGPAWPRDYPEQAVRLVVPAAPGGGTDAIARLLAAGLVSERRWEVSIDNIPGGGGNTGLELVAKAPKDGYTMGIGESSNLIINPYLYNKIPFSAETDLKPVVLLAKIPLVLVVASGSPFKSVRALLDEGKRRSISFASAGNGTVGHLTGELWKRMAGMALVHVPHKSAAPAMAAVADGAADLFFASVASSLPMIKAGRVRPLAVTSWARSPLLPAVPSLKELGFTEMEANVVFGIVVPMGTPDATVSTLNTEFNLILTKPAVRDAMSKMGADRNMFGGDPRMFELFLWQERLKWSRVVKESGATVD